MRLQAALVAVVLLVGCGTTRLMNEVIASWHGAHIDEAIARWGYPTDERTIAGRRLVYWDRTVTLDMPATSSTQGTATRVAPGVVTYASTTHHSGGGSSAWACVRTLEIDAAGFVVGGAWQGNNCPFAESGPYRHWRR